MEPIPLPSHVHYELLLQLLERQTLFSLKHKSLQQEQAMELIVTLRKALAQQKHLEESCQRVGLPIEYRWSLNSLELGEVAASSLPTVDKPSSQNPET